MEALDEDVGGTAGAGGNLSDPEDQDGPAGPDSRALPSALEGQCGPDGPSSPGDPHTQSVSCSPPGQEVSRIPTGQGGPGGSQCGGDLGASDNQGGAGGLGDPGDEERMSSAAIAAPTVAGAAQASGPRREAASSVAVGPRNRKMVFKLRVPFQCPVEAEIARRSMDQGREHHHQAVRKEFKVKGSVLAVWTAEDPGLLRVSVNAFLEKLCLVMRNIRCIWP